MKVRDWLQRECGAEQTNLEVLAYLLHKTKGRWYVFDHEAAEIFELAESMQFAYMRGVVEGFAFSDEVWAETAHEQVMKYVREEWERKGLKTDG